MTEIREPEPDATERDPWTTAAPDVDDLPLPEPTHDGEPV